MDPGPVPSAERLTWRTFDALTLHELYAVLRLRNAVFVVEQQSPYGDIDGQDLDALHLLASEAPDPPPEGLAGYLRVLPGGGAWRIGRVVVAPAHRATGLGGRLMAEAVRRIEAAAPGAAMTLSAQAHLERFYGRFGFARVSDDYLDDGIPHCDMRRGPG